MKSGPCEARGTGPSGGQNRTTTEAEGWGALAGVKAGAGSEGRNVKGY